MKIAIGYYLQDGPWGGGNQFALSLANSLSLRGDSVRFDLHEPDIDIILMTDPRARSPNVSFSASKIFRYLLKHPNAIVVHRINECDERKSTKNMNLRLRWANYVADHTVFIATWLTKLNVWRNESPHSIILNGADGETFVGDRNISWDGASPLKLVTHHWGGNYLKGFDVYAKIDELLTTEEWRDKLEFTFIGNVPPNFSFRNATHIKPLQGKDLALELAKHHIYVTASINEPAGMHHIEGAMSGLPILYRNSGALPEYCSPFGIQYEDADFVPALQRAMHEYASLKEKMPSYPHTAQVMCTKYLSLFDDLVSNKQTIIANRKLWRSPLAAIACHLLS
jgi:hypothetical protein